MSHLRFVANQITQDTLPGLSFAGEVNAHLSQGYNHSLMLLLVDSRDECRQLRRQIDDDNRVTTGYLTDYKKQIFESVDAALFTDTMRRRAEYLAVRERFFTLVENQQRSNALLFCQTDLTPAFNRYKAAGEKLFAYNIRQGRARSESIRTVCTATQLIVAGLGVLVFVAGFFVGLFR